MTSSTPFSEKSGGVGSGSFLFFSGGGVGVVVLDVVCAINPNVFVCFVCLMLFYVF